ncbi:MAG: VCBS domain-containing protein, partial [Legionella sp.]|nr:VCBS domain-containing protein [Legionella sp.]
MASISYTFNSGMLSDLDDLSLKETKGVDSIHGQQFFTLQGGLRDNNLFYSTIHQGKEIYLSKLAEGNYGGNKLTYALKDIDFQEFSHYREVNIPGSAIEFISPAESSLNHSYIQLGASITLTDIEANGDLARSSVHPATVFEDQRIFIQESTFPPTRLQINPSEDRLEPESFLGTQGSIETSSGQSGENVTGSGSDLPTVNTSAVIGGVATGTMKEDINVTGTSLNTSGTLTISDVDTGEAAFVAQNSVSGNYGSFSVNAAGEWTYAADNSQSAIQALPEGSTLTDTFSVASIDGTSQQITITINGTNDAAVIGGVATSTVKEDTAVSGGNLLASGTLTISDVDTGEAAFVAQNSVSGNYGSFSVNAAGEWTYAADNSQSAVQALPEGSSLTDTFSVVSLDGTSQLITITINGTNDA